MATIYRHVLLDLVASSYARSAAPPPPNLPLHNPTLIGLQNARNWGEYKNVEA